ncbi:MAG: AraC family transcriptional regulator [Rhodobacteraceae bacterium]|nr:AraC family transcriptional regulator [Paracoccaceae bacterium]
MAGAAGQHSAVFASMLANQLIQRGYAVEDIFHGTAFDASLLAEEAPTYPLVETVKFFERAAVLTKNENLGFQLGKEQDMRRAGLICYVGLAAPTAGGFLANFARYSRVASPALEVDKSHLQQGGVISWDYAISPSLKRRQYVEFSTASLLHTLRRFTVGPISPRVVRFQHNRRSQIDEFEAYFCCKVEFGAATNGFTFDPKDLDLPLTSADEQLLSVLQKYGDQVLAEIARQSPGLVIAVERAIAEQLGAGTVTLESVASGMGMSPRTLSRKLAAEGTSFFRLLENLRKSLAKSYLRDTNLVLAEIAFLLGYSGLGSFNEAFKRWTGHSPGQFRTE